MGKWIEEAERGLTCARCKSKVTKGERFWYQRKGVYYCELCGSLAEHEVPEAGMMERGVREDFSTLPPEAAESTLGEAMLYLARQLDSGDVQPRDVAPYMKELRQNLAALRELYPPAGDDDITDIIRKNREHMLGADFEEPYK